MSNSLDRFRPHGLIRNGLRLVFTLQLLFNIASCTIIDFLKEGGIPFNRTLDVANSNTRLFNSVLKSIQPGDIFILPNLTFHFNGGVYGSYFHDVTIRIDGTISFLNDRDTWPVNEYGSVLPCMKFDYISNTIFTAKDHGTIDGNGQEWWGAIQFLIHQEDRPRLFHMYNTRHIIVENLLFKDSPYWTFYAEESDGLIVRYSEVDVHWDNKQNHSLIDLQAFNTDGFDVTGRNVHMHDLQIWNDDDCVCVKDGSENMLFERINASGLGLVVGSIGNSTVRNITFRDSTMYNTFKGIYMKTRWFDNAPDGSASISDILYENITINNPEQWAIWIGPAQQTGQPCSLLWPEVPGAECEMTAFQTWSNIKLKDITINNPFQSPGILLGNASNPMQNVIFENVVVNNPGYEPWEDDYYLCENIEGYATGTTTPVPPCFTVTRT